MARTTIRPPPAFRMRFIAFLDVLGFKELVFQADDSIDARRTVRRAINILRGANNDRRNSGYAFTHFSDSIVLSADLTSVGARALMESCCRLSTELLNHGFLMRGGLTVGNIIHEEGLLYGRGMIDAYQLDQRGLPPRIWITKEAVEIIQTECTDVFVKRYTRTDEYDLSPMVHTLQEFARFGGATEKPEASRVTVANRIAARISIESTNLTLEPDARAKWRWLRGYWNRSMKKRGIINIA